MNYTFRIIPAPFEDSAETIEKPALPVAVPTGATFPDGTPFTAYRVNHVLAVDNTKHRLYAIRFGSRLVIFAHNNEEATTAAVVTSALVSPGVELAPDKDKSTAAYLLCHIEGDTTK